MMLVRVHFIDRDTDLEAGHQFHKITLLVSSRRGTQIKTTTLPNQSFQSTLLQGSPPAYTEQSKEKGLYCNFAWLSLAPEVFTSLRSGVKSSQTTDKLFWCSAVKMGASGWLAEAVRGLSWDGPVCP